MKTPLDELESGVWPSFITHIQGAAKERPARHTLKIETQYYGAVLSGLKKFEIRKNDRGFRVGDTLDLIEIDGGEKTGRGLFRLTIRYIFEGGQYGLMPGYCIFCW